TVIHHQFFVFSEAGSMQVGMDPKAWIPGQRFSVTMSPLPSQRLYAPMPQDILSYSELGPKTLAETRPPRTKKRPHTKSRQGCFNCKARRVKVALIPLSCQETQPHPCSNCVGRNMVCVYPSKDQVQRRRRPVSSEHPHRREEWSHGSIISTSTASPLTRWQTLSCNSPDTFSAADLRFLHHFLIAAYPHLPFGSEGIWKTSLPAYAHGCPHLMHSILCLGASHLSRITPNGKKYMPLAIAHRGKALKALGEALTTSDQCTRTELDLLLATTYALTIQSNYMEDGLVDFLVMVQGCAVITLRILDIYQGSEMFDSLTPEAIHTRILPLLPLTTCCDAEMLNISILTLEGIQPLLVTGSDRITYQAILNIYRGLQHSARRGFLALSEIYNSWVRIGSQEFREFLDPGNHVSRMLLLHFVAITVMMWPVFCILRPSMLETPVADLACRQWGG
ncbi:C6 transcription factor, partial [Penicillium desertorum]